MGKGPGAARRLGKRLRKRLCDDRPPRRGARFGGGWCDGVGAWRSVVDLEPLVQRLRLPVCLARLAEGPLPAGSFPPCPSSSLPASLLPPLASAMDVLTPPLWPSLHSSARTPSNSVTPLQLHSTPSTRRSTSTASLQASTQHSKHYTTAKDTTVRRSHTRSNYLHSLLLTHLCSRHSRYVPLPAPGAVCPRGRGRRGLLLFLCLRQTLLKHFSSTASLGTRIPASKNGNKNNTPFFRTAAPSFIFPGVRCHGNPRGEKKKACFSTPPGAAYVTNAADRG